MSIQLDIYKTSKDNKELVDNIIKIANSGEEDSLADAGDLVQEDNNILGLFTLNVHPALRELFEIEILDEDGDVECWEDVYYAIIDKSNISDIIEHFQDDDKEEYAKEIDEILEGNDIFFASIY